MEGRFHTKVAATTKDFSGGRAHLTGRRRLAFAALTTLTGAAMALLMLVTLARGGLDTWDLAMIGCFLVTLPWTVIGFWNAVIGLVLMRTQAEPARAVFPGVAAKGDDTPITTRTALLMCVRNEDAAQVARHLDAMIEGLAQHAVADRFHVYVLSDSDWPEMLDSEAAVFAGLRGRWRGVVPVTYRRREDNTGFKAGNIRDFCDRWGDDHDYALVLDADSLMAAPAILRMVRTMQRNPRLGILQSLIVGMPTVSPFARVFQFGMRLGMRSYTLGSAWWQGDCGPYWGHNALIRLRPFIDHCHLPVLRGGPPLGGPILSHDQVEAVLMRRAGYEVRVLAEEGGSWEENPPSLIEHIRRDLRWCHGNMQYWRLLGLPGLKAVSRIQLGIAILMYIGSPAWIAFMTLGALRVGLSEDPSRIFNAEAGWTLFVAIMTMVFAPKLATLAEALSDKATRQSFGGTAALATSTVGEIVLSTLLAPVLALAHTRFLVALPFGRAAIWPAQRRALQRVTFAQALQRLWPQTLFAALLCAWLVILTPGILLAFLPFVAGSLFAVPLAMLSANETFGSLIATRTRLWRIPEETAPSPVLRAVQLRGSETREVMAAA